MRICPVNEGPGIPVASQFNIEFRAADATASPYLALGALVRAGLEGLRQELPRPRITVVDPGTLSEDERADYGIARLPQSLEEALNALVQDSAAKGWFSEALFDAYLRHKRCELGLMSDLNRNERCARYKHAY